MLRILTLNTGLTRIRLLGLSLYSDVPHVDARAAHLAPALRALDADIVLLQELVPGHAKRRLAAELGGSHPHAAGLAEDGRFYGTGLLTLSRHPVEAASCTPFARQTLDEGLFGPRGAVCCTVRTPGLGPWRIVNLHVTAGGAWSRDRRRATACRRAQIAEAVSIASGAFTGPVVLAGDFNSDSPPPVEDGFMDAAGAPDPAGAGGTWDPANPLNRGKATGEARRVDRIFVRQGRGAPVSVVRARIVLRDPVVPLPGGATVPVSDHYGLLVELGTA